MKNEVEIEIWEIPISDSVMKVHGIHRMIREAYIPSEKIAINFEGKTRVFFSEDSRYEQAECVRVIMVKKSFVVKIREHLFATLAFEEKLEKELKDKIT